MLFRLPSALRLGRANPSFPDNVQHLAGGFFLHRTQFPVKEKTPFPTADIIFFCPSGKEPVVTLTW